MGNGLLVVIGLGESVTVNAILGLPTIREWKLVLDVDDGKAMSKVLGIYFDLDFQHATQGFPQGVSFNKNQFVRPPTKTNASLALLNRVSTSNVIFHQDSHRLS